MESFISEIYGLIGITTEAGFADVFGFCLLSLTIASTLYMFGSAVLVKDKKSAAADVKKVSESPKTEIKTEAKPEISWSDRLKKGLSKSRNEIWGKLDKLFTGKVLSPETLEEIEELLYGADLGPTTTQQILDKLEEHVEKGWDLSQVKKSIHDQLKNKMEPIQQKLSGDLFKFEGNKENGPKVIMVVGVNGAGKTTTIGKLATKLQNQGAHVVVGACDTFRAAAVDQLAVWCERAGAKMVRAKENSDPSGVGYEALQTAINEKADYCLLDTAGRLHTKSNLMDELGKSKRVLSKLDGKAPHEVVLVIDAITGQNALRQAKEFNQALNLTGLVFTKCDGSSKAGSAVSIVEELKVPIAYIGVGESVEDLNQFNVDQYLDAMLN